MVTDISSVSPLTMPQPSSPSPSPAMLRPKSINLITDASLAHSPSSISPTHLQTPENLADLLKHPQNSYVRPQAAMKSSQTLSPSTAFKDKAPKSATLPARIYPSDSINESVESFQSTSMPYGSMGSKTWNAAVRTRNADFHALFPHLAVTETLVEDYNCALQKEILVQGRIYISDKHLSFYSNLFGWTTNLMIPFTEILAIEKKVTAYVIPNAIQIVTSARKYFFTSFLFRDTVFQSMIDTWKRSRAVDAAVRVMSGNDSDAVKSLEPLIEDSNVVHIVTYKPSTTSFSDTGSSGKQYADDSLLNTRKFMDDSVQEEGDEEYASSTSASRRAFLKSKHPAILKQKSKTSKKDVSGVYSDFDASILSPITDSSGLANSLSSSINDSSVEQPPAICECYHQGVHNSEPFVLDVVVPVGLADVYSLLYGDDERFLRGFLEDVQKCKSVFFYMLCLKM